MMSLVPSYDIESINITVAYLLERQHTQHHNNLSHQSCGTRPTYPFQIFEHTQRYSGLDIFQAYCVQSNETAPSYYVSQFLEDREEFLLISIVIM